MRIILSVHQLVDYLLRKGSIDTRVYNTETMQEGTRIHLRYQQIQSGDYLSEVPLESEIEYEEFVFVLQGRADGIIVKKDLIIIDEIKSTNDDLENFYLVQGEWHLGQALCYAYMYAKEHHLDEMGIRLTYISQIDQSKMIKDFVFSFETITSKVMNLISEYAKYYRRLLNHRQIRNNSAKELEFPYEEFRKGQREVAKYVYKIANDGGLFFFEAPTGTGKTMSTIYPTVKTFANDSNDKIFYLSAKTQAKQVAFNAMKLLSSKGLECNSIVISSKEQMCLSEKRKCNPDDCPYAKDYFEKINRVVFDILSKEKNIDADKVFDYALANTICPFEFQLDISTFCDVIICDYNYLFDPLVYLQRFFDESKTPYFALIDEAHNLSERTKDMYTLAIEEEKIKDLRRIIKPYRLPTLKKNLKKLINFLDEVKSTGEEYLIVNGFEHEFESLLTKIFENMQDVLKNNDEYVDDIFIDCFRMINRFMKIEDYIDEKFITYYEVKDNVNAYIRCLDSSSLIQDSLKKLRGSILFSATLTPIEYYINTIGGDENTPYLKLPSPFDKNNLCLLVRSDISTRYKDRDRSYHDIAASIKAVCKEKVGNYLVFFSSYQYLINVLNVFGETEYNVIVQNKDMSNKDREQFLSSFVENPSKTTIGFAVLGGIFSEGIDLVSSRLIGAIIVGVGLPMVSFERNLLKDYYDKCGIDGFEYAYINPGKNKVMQAAGRVIRSQTDCGVVLLIDQRFTQSNYRDLFKLEWSHYKRVTSVEQISHHLQTFWNNH